MIRDPWWPVWYWVLWLQVATEFMHKQEARRAQLPRLYLAWTNPIQPFKR